MVVPLHCKLSRTYDCDCATDGSDALNRSRFGCEALTHSMKPSRIRLPQHDHDQEVVDLVEVNGHFVAADRVEASKSRRFAIELLLAAVMPWRVLSMSDQMWRQWSDSRTKLFLFRFFVPLCIVLAMVTHACLGLVHGTPVSVAGTLLFGCVFVFMLQIARAMSFHTMSAYAAISSVVDLVHLCVMVAFGNAVAPIFFGVWEFFASLCMLVCLMVRSARAAGALSNETYY